MIGVVPLMVSDTPDVRLGKVNLTVFKDVWMAADIRASVLANRIGSSPTHCRLFDGGGFVSYQRPSMWYEIFFCTASSKGA